MEDLLKQIDDWIAGLLKQRWIKRTIALCILWFVGLILGQAKLLGFHDLDYTHCSGYYCDQYLAEILTVILGWVAIVGVMWAFFRDRK